MLPFILSSAASLFALVLDLNGPAGQTVTAEIEPEVRVSALQASSPESRAIGAALRASRSASSRDTTALVERIVRAGPGALEASFDVLVERVVPVAVADDAPQVLSAPQRAMLLAAFARMPRAEVRGLVLARLKAAPVDTNDVQLAVVHLLGAVGSGNDLQRIAALAPRKPGEDAGLTRDARSAVREACASILARDARAWSVVADVIRTTDRSAARALLEAVGSERDPRALEVLFASVNVHSDLAPLAVASVQHVGPSLDGDVTREFTAWIAGEVPAARKEQRQGLLQAIGVLDDGTHAYVLIDALVDQDPAVREAAAWALRRLTGFGYPATPEPWRAWLRAEVQWHEHQRAIARANLQARDSARVVEGLRAYAGRRVWRDSLADDVAIVLDRKEPGLRILTCEVLQELNAYAAIRPLASLLLAPEEGVRDAARRALGVISGLDLPMDAQLAMEALDLL